MILKKDFNKIKKDLEGSPNVTMYFGNTQMQRFDYIVQKLTKFCFNKKTNIHIVDIGCGEGYYIKGLLKYFKDKNINVTYHAHDISPEEMDKIEMLVAEDELFSSVKTYRSLDTMIEHLKYIKSLPKQSKQSNQNEQNEQNEIAVLMSEVIEHIPIDQVNSFLVKLFTEIDFHFMILTTPNVDFNKHYLLNDNEFRHDDHKQEMTKEIFTNLINDTLNSIKSNPEIPKNSYSLYHENIGDVIDDVGMSQGIILEKNT
jgi:2-polyprenyl-3-methyl-5-hydroxy-6-metoxy-1,4-benzoquinol methylase